MRSLPALALLLMLTATASASPSCRVRARPWLEGRVLGSGDPARRAVDARQGQRVEVQLALPGTIDGRRVIFGESGATDRVSWRAAGCPAARIAWRRVEPRMQHEQTRSPNESTTVYSNAVMFGPRHGRWIGFDSLEYFETPVASDTPGGAWAMEVTGAHPTEDKVALLRDAADRELGTMHLAATVEIAGESYATPDARDIQDGTLTDAVFVYRYRRGDDFVGWITSYFNVPYLFGSAGRGARSQAERYVGADCADILVGGLRRAGLSTMDYSSVNGLLASLRITSGPTEIVPCEEPAHGCPAQPAPHLRFGGDVRPGDLLALDYIGADAALPRPWDHIVALVEDRGPDGKPDGVLGPEDLVADSGSAVGLHFQPLGAQGHVRVAVMRPKAPASGRKRGR